MFIYSYESHQKSGIPENMPSGWGLTNHEDNPLPQVLRRYQFYKNNVKKFLLWGLVAILSSIITVLILCLVNPSGRWISLMFLPMLVFYVFSIKWEKDYKKLSTVTWDAYTNDLNSFCAKFQISSFEKLQTLEIIATYVGDELRKRAIQINAKRGMKLLIDAEKEFQEFKEMHAAALKFGLARPDKNWYFEERG